MWKRTACGCVAPDFLSGVINGNIEFKTQYGLTGGDADFKDFYMGFLNKGSMPGVISKIRVGQQYEPFGRKP